jgi:hypothetical protein
VVLRHCGMEAQIVRGGVERGWSGGPAPFGPFTHGISQRVLFIVCDVRAFVRCSADFTATERLVKPTRPGTPIKVSGTAGCGEDEAFRSVCN